MKKVTSIYPPAQTPDPARFAHAVQLAAAFVANGDIRIGKGIRKGGALQEIGDLIPELYRMLEDVAEECTEPHQPPSPGD